MVDQWCKMKFGSWTYDGNKINLTTKDDFIDLSTYQISGEWDLLETPAVRQVQFYDCCVEPYIDITFSIHIRRRTLYYGFNLIIPCALISMLTLLTFILPPDEGEKIGLGITILLSLSVFQLIVAEMVPSTSMAVPLVGVYFACVMIMCTISVTTTVIVLNFHHRSPEMYEMPSWVRKVICEWLAWILRMSRPGRSLSRRYLQRKARMRELTAKSPPSMSLMSNIKDVDNAIPLNNYSSRVNVALYALPRRHGRAPPLQHSASSGDTDTSHLAFDGDGVAPGAQAPIQAPVYLRAELLAILNELRFITRKIKDENDNAEETNDWKFAAMVIDRLCFWIFSLYLVIATIAIFTSPKIALG